jgi:predicted small secreted protein
MMKKLFLLFLVVVLAAFFLVGCIPVTPGEGEVESETEVTVVIEDAVFIDGKTYVSDGVHDITVTFPAPVAGVVTVDIT